LISCTGQASASQANPATMSSFGEATAWSVVARLLKKSLNTEGIITMLDTCTCGGYIMMGKVWATG